MCLLSLNPFYIFCLPSSCFSEWYGLVPADLKPFAELHLCFVRFYSQCALAQIRLHEVILHWKSRWGMWISFMTELEFFC